jgi:hypothetical protein
MSRHPAGEEIEEIVEVRGSDFCSVLHRVFIRAVLAAGQREKRQAASNHCVRGYYGNARKVEQNAKRNYSGGSVFNQVDAEVGSVEK